MLTLLLDPDPGLIFILRQGLIFWYAFSSSRRFSAPCPVWVAWCPFEAQI